MIALAFILPMALVAILAEYLCSERFARRQEKKWGHKDYNDEYYGRDDASD